MRSKSQFKHHRFPHGIILCAVRWYLRFPRSYQDVVDLLAERGITVYRWVIKFGPEITKRTEKYLRWAGVYWHVDETYTRIGGKWRPLWRAIDANAQMVDFRLTARRDAKAAKAFLTKAIERIQHIDKKRQNNLIERDHASMKRLLGYHQSFRSLRTAKATLSGIETIRTIKCGHIHQKQQSVKGEVRFIGQLFEAP